VATSVECIVGGGWHVSCFLVTQANEMQSDLRRDTETSLVRRN